jgi:hypothetical protein
MLKMMETRLLSRTETTMQALIADVKSHVSREIHQLRQSGGGGDGGNAGDGEGGGVGNEGKSRWDKNHKNHKMDDLQFKIRDLTSKVEALTQDNRELVQLVKKLCNKPDKGSYPKDTGTYAKDKGSYTSSRAPSDSNLRASACKSQVAPVAELGRVLVEEDVIDMRREGGMIDGRMIDGGMRRDASMITRARSHEQVHQRTKSRSRGREAKKAKDDGATKTVDDAIRADAAAAATGARPAPAGFKHPAPDRHRSWNSHGGTISNPQAGILTAPPRSETLHLGLDQARSTVKSMPQQHDKAFNSRSPSGNECSWCLATWRRYS